MSADGRCPPRREPAPQPTPSPRSSRPSSCGSCFLRPRPNQAIEFNPDGTDAIPRLFDEFDRIAEATAGREVKGELPPHPERLFQLSLVDPAADVATEAEAFRPAFAHLSLLVQIPGVDARERMAAEKGTPLTAREEQVLFERVTAVRRWLETYAPEGARYNVQPSLPAEVTRLGDEQRVFLGALALRIEEGGAPGSGAEWQAAIFEVATSGGLAAGRAFGALYIAFLGRPNGPRAGWLLASLEPAFVEERLREAAGWQTTPLATAGAGDHR